MKQCIYVVLDNGGDTLEGIVDAEVWNAFVDSDTGGYQLSTRLDVHDMKKLIVKMEHGLTNITAEELDHFTQQ